ncbi:Protein kinase-like domain protein [Niveomyces insectorum RCEF 264]|uniref:EKC/KEOPS complex subunit BUD32 n=1 Tax=Niveomyces insectorum RCEF 264 TaxID=1081102 RepID=A0A167LW61_9HYPO|nr:Protein kinase-like domain protein [Niveomyces insectorum RCEF 264]
MFVDVLHCDMRAADMLADETTLGHIGLWLADLGGTVCHAFGIDGTGLSSIHFYPAAFNNTESEAIDLVGLGSLRALCYTIAAGRRSSTAARKCTTSTLETMIVGMSFDVIVTCTDDKTVLKGYQAWENGKLVSYCEFPCEEQLAREAYLYRHIGPHPRILTFYGLEEVHPGIHSLRLEYAPFRDLRQYMKTHSTLDDPGTPPLAQRHQMALDVAVALAYVHSRGVYHADISARNLFLFPGFRLKLGDFGGSGIVADTGGHAQHDPEYTRTTTHEESDYFLPPRGRAYHELPPLQRELFALGSALYEIVAWRRVYGPRVDPDVIADDDVRYKKRERGDQLPPLDDLGRVGPIIQRCWDEQYERAIDVVADLQAAIDADQDGKIGVRPEVMEDKEEEEEEEEKRVTSATAP